MYTCISYMLHVSNMMFMAQLNINNMWSTYMYIFLTLFPLYMYTYLSLFALVLKSPNGEWPFTSAFFFLHHMHLQ